MRKEFAETIAHIMSGDEKTVFITGDLGFMALENVRQALGDRFINAGVSEQNMISLAAGLAAEGLKPLCYSIAPFIAFRPAEQIRLDVCLHNMNVKLVGNGGGYGYGIMGATHHAIEDIAVLSSFQNMKCFIPWCNEDVPGVVRVFMERTGPSYLRMGFGPLPAGVELPPVNPIRKIRSGKGLTVVGIGPVILNVISALSSASMEADVFVVSQMPLHDIGDSLRESLKKSEKLLLIEEHVTRGGLAEMLSLMLLKEGLHPKLRHVSAIGYPDGLYGSQKYHHKMCGLDPDALAQSILEFIHD